MADFDDKLKNLNRKVTSNKSKHLLVENELKELQDKDSSLFIGRSDFFNNGAQFYLIFQALYYTLKRLDDTEKIVSWKSKDLSAETLIYVFLHQLNGMEIQMFVCYLIPLKQKSATFTLPNRITFFIIYELGTWSQDLNSNFTLKDWLFGDVKLAKNADPDNNVCSGYGIGLDLR